jgi:hypothetical protein
MNPSLSALAEGKFAEFTIQGSRIKAHYYEAGESDKHIIFLQTRGGATSAFMCWYTNLEAFAKVGCHVYAPDAVGFGLTEIISGSGINPAELSGPSRRLGLSFPYPLGDSSLSLPKVRTWNFLSPPYD